MTLPAPLLEETHPVFYRPLKDRGDRLGRRAGRRYRSADWRSQQITGRRGAWVHRFRADDERYLLPLDHRTGSRGSG